MNKKIIDCLFYKCYALILIYQKTEFYIKITKILIAGLTSTCMTISAMAEVSQPIVVAPTTDAMVFDNHLDNADLNYAFGGSENLQIQAMTSQEMNETQGVVVPVYALGAFMINTGGFIVTRHVFRKNSSKCSS